MIDTKYLIFEVCPSAALRNDLLFVFHPSKIVCRQGAMAFPPLVNSVVAEQQTRWCKKE